MLFRSPPENRIDRILANQKQHPFKNASSVPWNFAIKFSITDFSNIKHRPPLIYEIIIPFYSAPVKAFWPKNPAAKNLPIPREVLDSIINWLETIAPAPLQGPRRCDLRFSAQANRLILLRPDHRPKGCVFPLTHVLYLSMFRILYPYIRSHRPPL